MLALHWSIMVVARENWFKSIARWRGVRFSRSSMFTRLGNLRARVWAIIHFSMITARPRGERPEEVRASSISFIWFTEEHSSKTSRARFSFWRMATKMGWLLRHSCCFVNYTVCPFAVPAPLVHCVSSIVLADETFTYLFENFERALDSALIVECLLITSSPPPESAIIVGLALWTESEAIQGDAPRAISYLIKG